MIVALAAVAGIAVIQGWLPASLEGDTPASIASPGLRIAGTVPPESLSPGETVITESAEPEATPPPGAAPPAPAQESARKPAPRTPAYASKPAPRRERAAENKPPARGLCANCGTIASATYHENERHPGGAWEVRVQFDDGSRKSMRFPTDPGLRAGDRVFFANGRLHRD